MPDIFKKIRLPWLFLCGGYIIFIFIFSFLFPYGMDEYYQGLCVFASAYLKDDDLSADVVQEAFVKFWKRFFTFNVIKFNIKPISKCSPRAKTLCWLYRTFNQSKKNWKSLGK
jgi:hypothetical protein